MGGRMDWDKLRRGRDSGGWGPHVPYLGDVYLGPLNSHDRNAANRDASAREYELLLEAGYEGPRNLDGGTAQLITRALLSLNVTFREVKEAREAWDTDRLARIHERLAGNRSKALGIRDSARHPEQRWRIADAVEGKIKRLERLLRLPLPGKWTAERDARLIQLHADGRTCAYISAELGCSQDQVRRRLRHLRELM